MLQKIIGQCTMKQQPTCDADVSGMRALVRKQAMGRGHP